MLGRWLVGRPALMKVNDVLLAHGGVAPSSSSRTVEAVNDSMWTFMSEDLFYHWADTTLALVTDSATGKQLEDQYERVIVMDPAAVTRRAELLFNETGILWFRGYVESDGLTEELDGVLAEFGAGVHVVAHTPVRSIQSRYDGKLLAVDLERPATEMLLLVWDPGEDRYQRWRLGLDAPPEPF